MIIMITHVLLAIILLPSVWGCEKFVYSLIVMFLSTEIFSKRRKIYTSMKRNQSYWTFLGDFDLFLPNPQTKRCEADF